MLISPTKEQQAILIASSPRILVEANAGAAKTTTAAMKMWEWVNRGTDPSKICAFAFSQPGVQAYKNAFRRIGMPEPIASQIKIGTIDDFCAARLKKIDTSDVSKFKRAQQVKPFVLEAIRSARDKAERKFPGTFSISGDGTLAVEQLLNAFAYLKGSLAKQRYGETFTCSPTTADDLGCGYTTLAVFCEYEKSRTAFLPPDDWDTKFRYLGDATYDMAQHVFDDPPWIGSGHPLELGLQGIVLDEMHDCSWSIFTVIRNLTVLNPSAQFLGVGDRDQVIHGQHGADSYFMGPDLDKEIGEVARLPLTLTHRFGMEIAKPLALHSRKKYATTDRHTQIFLRPALDANDNAGIIFEMTSRLTRSTDSSGDDFAVLLRHPGTSVEIEHSLILKGMGFQTLGFMPFLQRPEIALVRMLLSIAVDHDTAFTKESFIEAKRAVWHFIGSNPSLPMTQGEPEQIIEKAKESDFKSYVFPALLKDAKTNVSNAIHAALAIAESDDPSDLAEFISKLCFPQMAIEVFVSQSDVDEAIFSINSFAKIAQNYSSINALLEALNAIDFEQRKTTTARHRIQLSTIEDAKGLEFRHVFIPDCNATLFDGDNQDERNLFYVAASRARDNLFISYKPSDESSFVRQFMHTAN